MNKQTITKKTMFDYYPWNHDALFAQLANEKKNSENFV